MEEARAGLMQESRDEAIAKAHDDFCEMTRPLGPGASSRRLALVLNPIEGEGCQKRSDEIAGFFLDEQLSPFVRASEHESSVDAVHRSLFYALDMRLEHRFVARPVNISHDHSQDFLDGDLPCGIDSLKLARWFGHPDLLDLDGHRQEAAIHAQISGSVGRS